ncbi:TetR/AcrR family transcriptional regulator [Streptomyces yaizuensis]|uniref:TetR family transcriptional regulator n=1 Tax=Streptomyces yaizuensis TaxID=2989713 RepID=A0ABQ5P8B4_9ACTN|nr:TetR family transcriptional regulator [Streptomyces sp. YSPA8]GLF98824.1 TetR family transcriptional regulator [Streptomyces sp. YSPA8]
MTTPSFQRARRPEHKEQRRQDILRAAAELGRREGVRPVTLTDIAAGAGVHKSAVLRYFASREAVFLLLTADGWQDWADAAGEALRGPGDPATVAAALAGTLADRPLFCDLLGHAQLNLERGVTQEQVRDFKVTTLDAVDRVALALTTALPWMDRGQAVDVIAGTTAMAAQQWQTSNPPDTLARLYAEDPLFAHVASEFAPRLTRLVTLLLTGAAAAAPGAA